MQGRHEALPAFPVKYPTGQFRQTKGEKSALRNFPDTHGVQGVPAEPALQGTHWTEPRFFAPVPTPQGSQAELPVTFVLKSTAHRLHVVCPNKSEYWPGKHSLQVELLD